MVTTAPVPAVGGFRTSPQAAAARRRPGAAAAPGRPAGQGSAAGTATRADGGAPARLRTLDALRFLAAAGVLVYHFTARQSVVWGEAPGDRFPVLGNVAIYFSLAPELFFVLSGFVILWTAWGRSVPSIVASRVARLYPAYWAALALTSVLLLLVWPEGKRISLTDVAVNTTLFQAALGVQHVDGVYWTLWAELRFYLLMVVLAAVGLTTRRVLAVAAAWPVLATVAHHEGWHVLSTVLIGGYAPYFAGGMALFLVWRDGHRVLPWAVVALNAVLGTHGVGLGKGAVLDATTPFTTDPWLLGAASVGCFAAVGLAVLTPLARWDAAWLTTVGALTYPLYLVHQFWGLWVIDMLEGHLPTWLVLGAAVAVSVGLALAVHHLVERRMQKPLRAAVERALDGLGARLGLVAARVRAAVDPRQPA